jgi:hypothetical protein
LRTVTRLGLPNCLLLSNGTVEVVVTTDVGPRVVHYGFAGAGNVLGECPSEVVETEWGEWRPWGGHRLWTAPEASPRSYHPDDEAVAVEAEGELGVRLTPPVEGRAGVQKELTVTLDAEGSGVTLRHRVWNRGTSRVELAAWALTIMRGGGEIFIPQEPYGPHPQHLLPARPLVLWPYTDMSDPRLRFGRRLIRVRSDAALDAPQKLGVANKLGWAAYLTGGTLFVKRFGYEEGARYPDLGCNNEVFTAGSFVEVESLSKLVELEPGEPVEHVERWSLFKDFTAGDADVDFDVDLEAAIIDRLQRGGV